MLYTWSQSLIFIHRSGNYFSEPLKQLWTKVFETALPPIRHQVNEEVKDIVAKFSQTVEESVGAICPQVNDSLRSVTEAIAQQGLVLHEAYLLRWDANISSGRSESHRSLKHQILKSMTEAYEDAAEETGQIKMATASV